MDEATNKDEALELPAVASLFSTNPTNLPEQTGRETSARRMNVPYKTCACKQNCSLARPNYTPGRPLTKTYNIIFFIYSTSGPLFNPW